VKVLPSAHLTGGIEAPAGEPSSFCYQHPMSRRLWARRSRNATRRSSRSVLGWTQAGNLRLWAP
jgi:hypothetical protein